MPFNTILGPTKLNQGTSDTDPATYPALTALSDGSFAVAYEVIQVDSPESPQIVTEAFDTQCQLVQETFAAPLVASWLMPDQGAGTDLMAVVFNSAGQQGRRP
jgi:hypothetical protein